MTLLIPAALIAIGSAGAMARTFEAWGFNFDYPEPQPRMMDVTVATEKSTGHKMNLVRLKNGHMMALVPADRYLALMSTSDEDMVR